jgi:hypothetical protein
VLKYTNAGLATPYNKEMVVTLEIDEQLTRKSTCGMNKANNEMVWHAPF